MAISDARNALFELQSFRGESVHGEFGSSPCGGVGSATPVIGFLRHGEIHDGHHLIDNHCTQSTYQVKAKDMSGSQQS